MHTYMRAYIHTYIHTCICIQTYIHTCIHTYIHTYMHTCIHTYIHTYVRTYLPTYLRVYIHRCKQHGVQLYKIGLEQFTRLTPYEMRDTYHTVAHHVTSYAIASLLSVICSYCFACYIAVSLTLSQIMMIRILLHFKTLN